MRVLGDHRKHFIVASQSYSPTPQVPSLSSTLGKLSDEWQIQCLILLSFGLQVFLFLAAGMRRRSVSSILKILLWLAYLSADSVAIFVLGHLALHANGTQHQLLFFWAPFVLLHLGGQDTVTALSMQDNDLWLRHLLGLVTQVGTAGYVVSRTSWPDWRLLAAMVLLFLSGCFKYAERTICLYRASPTGPTESLMWSWGNFPTAEMKTGSLGDTDLTERFENMVKANGRQHSSREWLYSLSGMSLVSDSPINDYVLFNYRQQALKSLLQGLKSNQDRCRVYNYVSIRTVIMYERLYTKVPLRVLYIRALSCIQPLPFFGENYLYFIKAFCFCILGCIVFSVSFLFLWLVAALFLFFPFLSTSMALALFFKVAEKGQLYSQADVAVSYTLLIGAIILEVASLVIFVLSYIGCWDIFQSGRKQWSEILGQYNLIKSLARHDSICIMSFVPYWIGKHLGYNTSRVPISEDLKKFVLDKLCDFGSREEDWNFASSHGKLALEKWMDAHKDFVSPRLKSPLKSSISDLDLPTSVLILHIATDILYLHDNKTINSEQQTMKKLSRELSNYMMYLIFKCGAMLKSGTKVLHGKAHSEMDKIIEKHTNIGDNEAIIEVFEASKDHRSLSEQEDQVRVFNNTLTALGSPILLSACYVAQELIGIHGEADCWDLVAEVWVEMLYYMAPRCGGAFHSHHLNTGGEFITHVLFLMQLLGPFLPPPSS